VRGIKGSGHSSKLATHGPSAARSPLRSVSSFVELPHSFWSVMLRPYMEIGDLRIGPSFLLQGLRCPYLIPLPVVQAVDPPNSLTSAPLATNQALPEGCRAESPFLVS